jgi:glycosyltransferase involved in cell wall biosynthesis
VSKGVREDKIDVIPTGVNLSDFEKKDPSIIRNRYGLQGKLVVMYTGSFAAFQGLDYLIQSMKKVFGEHRNVVLVLVGDSKNKEILDMCSQKKISNHVIVIGDRPFEEIPFFLASADVVVVPRTECPGIPQKLSNYMAAEKPIVCFEGAAKLLVHEYNGLIVENGNTDAMANAIVTLLKSKDLRRKLAKNAKSTLIGKYEWRCLCREIEVLYYRLLNHKIED